MSAVSKGLWIPGTLRPLCHLIQKLISDKYPGDTRDLASLIMPCWDLAGRSGLLSLVDVGGGVFRSRGGGLQHWACANLLSVSWRRMASPGLIGQGQTGHSVTYFAMV